MHSDPPPYIPIPTGTDGWFRPSVLELADSYPSCTAKEIAAYLDRLEPEHAPVSVEDVRAVLEAR